MSQSVSAPGLPDGGRPDDNRREFIRGSSLLLAGALPASALSASGTTEAASFHAPRREIKLGLVGCGARGMSVVSNLLSASPLTDGSVRLTTVADVFPDRMHQLLRGLKSKYPQQVTVDTTSRCAGLNGFRQLLDSDVDLVVLATPPTFRPLHFEATVDAAKHVYAEKPIAVDIAGVQRFQSANQRALKQGLVVGVGLPRRFHPQFQATMARLHSGAIGRLVSARALQCTRIANLVTFGKSATKLESQLRNWTRHAWASGGAWVEPHVQNLDVINWLVGAHPNEARPIDPLSDTVGSWLATAGLRTNGSNGGRHEPSESPCAAAVEFGYADGIKLLSYCQTVDNTQPTRLSLTVQGTDGHCDLAAGKIFSAKGQLVWRAGSLEPEAGMLDSLVTAIAAGQKFNQGADAIESTLTAILGRTACLRGQRVTWNELTT